MTQPLDLATALRNPPRDAVPPTLAQAQAFCRGLARSHHENFTVASFLLPRELRQHFCNVYTWCRLADDLADEAGSPEQRLDFLDAWQEQFDRCQQGRALNEVSIALWDTMQTYGIPRQPLESLLLAFRQDQVQQRYETVEELEAYCRHSAQPVGRIVLYLGRCHDEERGRLSDSICSGLQWANFCQDVARDWDAGRIYLPQESCRAFGYREADFAGRRANDAFRQLLACEVERAEAFLRAGEPLVALMPKPLQLDVALFVAGGLAVLEAIRRQRFDVWSRRPIVGNVRKLRLMARCWWRLRSGSQEPRNKSQY